MNAADFMIVLDDIAEAKGPHTLWLESLNGLAVRLAAESENDPEEEA